MSISLKWGVGAVLLLAGWGLGCGGGGGGGDNGPDFRVTLERSSVAFAFEEGQAPGTTWIKASATGTPPGALYIGTATAGDGIDPSVLIDLGGPEPRIGIAPLAGLLPGNYTGTVDVYVCADLGCAQPIGGTPLRVTCAVAVAPTFKVTPRPLPLAAVGGNAVNAALNVQLPTGAASFTARVTTSSPWLSVGAPAGNVLPVTAASWRAGSYQGSIEVATGARTIIVPVSYTVTAPPGGEQDLKATPARLDFAASENAAAPAKPLSISLPSWGSASDVSFSVQYSGPTGWLSVSRTGSGADVVASAAALPQGTYNATVRITPAAPGTAVSVPVSMVVGPGMVRPADQTIDLGVETIAAQLSGAATVNTVAGPAIAWTARSSVGWLTVKPSGTTGTDLTFSADAVALRDLTNFADHRATVTIQPGPSHVTPVSFDVVVRKAMPEVQFIGPYLAVAGQTTRVRVRGRGFDAVAAFASRLDASGLTLSGLSRVNDTELVASVTPADVGDRAFTMSNAMGWSTGAATLKVIAPQTYGYAAIASAGAKRAIVVDAERRAVYAVNVGNGELNRFRYDGAGWSTDSVSVTSILDAGLGPDGSALVVTATPGTLRLLDPATLATGFTLVHAPGFARNLTYTSQGIATTNDGRSWLAVGSGWGELAYFDHRSRTMKPRPTQQLTTSFYGGPWTAMARGGERMLVTQSAGITPRPPLLYLDAKDSLLHNDTGGMTFFYDASLSDEGDRALIDQYEVRDAAFAVVGGITLPSTYSSRAGAMSPDGSRAYVLAYPTDKRLMPRVFAFNARPATPGGTLSLIGTFDLLDYPTCVSTDASCNQRPRSAISPDGATLFFGGEIYLVVAPIPAL